MPIMRAMVASERDIAANQLFCDGADRGDGGPQPPAQQFAPDVDGFHLSLRCHDGPLGHRRLGRGAPADAFFAVEHQIGRQHLGQCDRLAGGKQAGGCGKNERVRDQVDHLDPVAVVQAIAQHHVQFCPVQAALQFGGPAFRHLKAKPRHHTRHPHQRVHPDHSCNGGRHAQTDAPRCDPCLTGNCALCFHDQTKDLARPTV